MVSYTACLKVSSFSILLRQKWRVDYTHSVAISLHALRNVAGNYQEVMDASAELFRECFHRVFGLGHERAEATRGLLSAPMTTSGAESALPEAVSEAAGNPQESHGCHHGEVPETQNLNDLLQPKEPAAPEIALSTAEEAVWMAHSLLNVGHCRAPCSLLELAGAYPASQAAVAKTGRVAG